MAPWGSPAGGALAEASAPDDRPERRSALAGRSAFAPVALGFSSIAGVIAAVVALLPAAFSRGPNGRRAAAQHTDAEQASLRR
ncbi:MAG TPA: hypothetical protein VF894_02435 [Anaeromyxobacter sp.]